jgi:putative aldouronate transport system permease protein
MEAKYRLFLMFMPFALLILVFSYLPLWGWRYAFFDYKAGDTLTMDKWRGLF